MKYLTTLFLKYHLKNIAVNFELHMKSYSIITLFFLLMAVNCINAQSSKLEEQGTATQLLINNEPYLVLGGE